MIPAGVAGLTPAALLDSGSTLSIISERLADILEAHKEAEREPCSVVADVYGTSEQVRFTSRMKVRVSFEGVTIVVTMVVHPQDTADLLLGHDVLKSIGVMIDYLGERVKLCDTWVPFLRRGPALDLYASIGALHYDQVERRIRAPGPETKWVPCAQQ